MSMLMGQILNRNRSSLKHDIPVHKVFIRQKGKREILQRRSLQTGVNQVRVNMRGHRKNEISWPDRMSPVSHPLYFCQSWNHDVISTSSNWGVVYELTGLKIWQMCRFWDSRNDGGAGQTADHEENMILDAFWFGCNFDSIVETRGL